MSNNIVFHFSDQIKTNYTGYTQLSRFYHFCLGHPPNSTFHLDFTNVEWFDGNLCALLSAMGYYLNRNFGHTFTTDTQVIMKRFDVLYRNGFFAGDSNVVDERQSTVPIHCFDCSDLNGFCNYIENKLLNHRGIPSSLNSDLKEKIQEDLLEVFCNTNFHANTQDPFFVGGQFYPMQGYLKFTMVDLGDGFFPRINKATQGIIKNDIEAILWALDGNSSKKVLDKCPGGLGIKNMYKYCRETNGVLQIISGGGFWSSDLENTVFQGGREILAPFIGTTINLFFKKD